MWQLRLDLGNTNGSVEGKWKGRSVERRDPTPYDSTRKLKKDARHDEFTQRRVSRLGDVEYTLSDDLGRNPTISEQIAASNIPINDILSLRDVDMQMVFEPFSGLAGKVEFKSDAEGSSDTEYPTQRMSINSLEAHSNIKSGLRGTIAHEVAHTLQNRGQSSLYPLQGVPIRPYLEGGAEGYGQKYTQDQKIEGVRKPYKYEPGYSKDMFSDVEHGPEVFELAKKRAYETGNPGNAQDVLSAWELSDVLHSDIANQGQGRHGTTNRMLINNLQKSLGRLSPQFEKEFQNRTIAIEGETVQSSLFPELVPETNQFGSKPSKVQRSMAGESKFKERKDREEATFERLRNMES